MKDLFAAMLQIWLRHKLVQIGVFTRFTSKIICWQINSKRVVDWTLSLIGIIERSLLEKFHSFASLQK